MVRALGSGQLSGVLLQTHLAACMLQPEALHDCSYVAFWRLEGADRILRKITNYWKHQVQMPEHRLYAKACLCSREQAFYSAWLLTVVLWP